jgi:phosphohistidine swiveling domain-containing protein
MLVSAATAPASSAADAKSKPATKAATDDLTVIYQVERQKIIDIYDERYTEESRGMRSAPWGCSSCSELVLLAFLLDQLLFWIEALRESLLWKERIHIAYTLNHYFLRLVIVEATRRVAAATADGNGVFGWSDADKRYISADAVWQAEFPVLTRLLKPPHNTKTRTAGGSASVALGSSGVPGLYPHTTTGVPQLSETARFEYATEIGAKASNNAVSAFRQHLWVRGALRKMYTQFAPPARLGAGAKKKISVAADAVKAVGVGEAASGLGCSPGQAVGRARVVQSLEEAGSVQRGEVLITRYTQPSWTPLFSLVVAVVLEEGGMLSHAAVVSRECGVPSVVQVKDATRRFRTGQLVLVDGTNGTVSLAKEEK